MHKDKNSVFKETVKAQAHKKTVIALERALQALEEMKANNLVINFNSLANYAKVSKAWLYRNKNLRKEISDLREYNLNHRASNPACLLSLKDKEIALLKQKIIILEKEKKKLREQIEIVYGQLHNNT